MSDKSKIWFPFYVGDYLADTAHLSTAEHGAYLLILCHQWRQGHIEDGDFARIARMDPDTWSITQVRLKNLLSIDEKGLFFSGRLDREKTQWDDKRTKAREKAVKAINTRWKRVREEKAKQVPKADFVDTPSITQVVPENYPSPSPVSTPPSLRSGGEGVSPAGGDRPEVAGKEREKKAKTAKKRGGGARARREPSKAAVAAAQHRNTVALGLKAAAVVSAAMSRRAEWLLPELRSFWSGLNSVSPAEMPWSDRDQSAMMEMLGASPGFTDEKLRRCLEHRSIAVELGYLSASLQPSKWLRDLPSFLAGPLNEFGDVLPKVGGHYKRKGDK